MDNTCTYCKNKATHRRSIDIDCKSIPMCDDQLCFIKLYISINPGLKISKKNDKVKAIKKTQPYDVSAKAS